MKFLKRFLPRGQIVIMTAVALVVIFAIAGLVVDAGMGYLIKAKLNAAVDAASVAAARAVTDGSTQAQQETNAKRAARIFFDANYPSGWLGTVPTFNEPAVAFNGGKITIDVSASATKPVTFMRVLDFTDMTVAAGAQIVRKDLDMSFVVDVTDSMQTVAKDVKDAAGMFLNQFNPTTDRVALVHFAYGAEVDDPIRTSQRGFDRPTEIDHINRFNYNPPNGGGFTNYSEGFWNARDQLNGIPSANRSSLRVIVFFSDGSPNTFASRFGFNNPADCATPGALATGAGTSGNPDGLWLHNRQKQHGPGNCYRNNIASYLTATALPDWFNPHDPNEQDFRVVGGTPWTVTSAPTWRNINRASRNLPQAMALKSRQEGIYVFTLGLGSYLHESTGPDNVHGEDLLKSMANTPDSQTYDPAQPVGVYCYADTEADLKPCFAKLASEIMRITR